MKLPKPAAADAVGEAAHQVTLRTDELDAVRAEIAAAEGALPALAESDDDARYEETSLAIERLRRSETRAAKRLEAAQTAHAEAEAREDQGRRQTLFEAGTKAKAEVERLAAEYGKRAAAVAETLHEIHKHAEVIRIANENRPDYAPWSDVYGLRIYEGVRLPAAVKSGATIWPLDEPRGRAWQPPRLADLPPSAPRSEQPAGPHVLENGARRYRMAPCDFGRSA